jgi:hypothetical protein
MEKNLYYELTDNVDISVTATIEDCMKIIDGNVMDNAEMWNHIEFTLKPVYLSDEEYKNLPESTNH